MARRLGNCLPRRWLVGAIVAFCVAGYLWRNVVVAVPYLRSGSSDFTNYWLAARALLAGASPFSAPNFDYPALLAFLIVPISGLSESTARLVWFVASHLFMIGAAALLWRRLGSDRTALAAVAAVWACGGTVAENLVLGQVNPFLLLLVVASWSPGWQARPRGAGLVGAAAAIKLWPAALLFKDVLARRWRAVATGVAVATALIVIPWGFVAVLLPAPHAPPRAGYWAGTPALLNSSVPAVALRLVEPPRDRGALPANWVVGNDPGHVRLSATQTLVSPALAAAILAAGLLLLHRRVRRGGLAEDEEPIAAAALVALALAAAPIAWYHYQLLNFPGFALLAARWVRRRRATALVFLAAVLILASWPAALAVTPYVARHGWTAAQPVWLWIATSVTPLAGLTLFGALLSELHRGNEPPPAVEVVHDAIAPRPAKAAR